MVGLTPGINIVGDKAATYRLANMGVAARVSEPALQEIADLIFRIMKATFDSEGRRGGGSWKADSYDWLRRKHRQGLDPRIGHATLALRNSVSIRGADHQQLEVANDHVQLSSDLPYAETEQEHRPFFKFTKTDEERMALIESVHLINAFNASARALGFGGVKA